MTIYLDGHTLKFEVENICRMFFPFEKVEIAYGTPVQENYIYTHSSDTEEGRLLTAKVSYNSQLVEDSMLLAGARHSKSDIEFAFASLLFPMLEQCTGIRPAWGLLTGIRPVKLLRQMAQEKGLLQAAECLRNDWKVSDKKVKLALETEAHESKVLNLSAPKSYSLYLSIPFCPSRCKYCSFVSHSIEMAQKLLPQYLELMCKELEHTAKLAK